MSERPRVLVADDHCPLRAELCRDLESTGFDVCAEAADAAGALAGAMRERPDICVLDIGMPGDGLGAAWDISRSVPSTRVVILTVSGDTSDMLAAVRAGAAAYLHKDLLAEELAAELRAVLRGERRFPELLPPEALSARPATARESVTRADRLR